MKRLRSKYFLLLLNIVCGLPLMSQQSIEVKPEKTQIMLGEPMLLTISVEGDRQYDASIGDSLGRFEVLEKKPATTRKENGRVITEQELTVTSFDSGIQRIPPVAVSGNPNIVSAGLDITVNTLPADAETKYGDIKQIIRMEPPEQWPYIAGLALATLVSAFGIYRLNRRLMLLPEPEINELPLPVVPVSSLVQQLEILKTDWLEGRINSLMLGNRLMEIFRKYLSGKGIYASSKTGEELVLATKNLYDAQSWQRIVQTIRLCNAMRFGKFGADTGEGENGIAAFENAIRQGNTSPTS